MSKQTLLPKKEDKKFELQLFYTLQAPVICWVGCEGDVDKKMRETYQLEGMLHIQEIFEKEEAPDYHCMIYLSQRSLIDPLGHTFSRIYMWLGKKYWGDKADWLKDVQPLDINEQEHLTSFRKWIFKKQIEHLKQKLKGLTN